MSCPNPTNLSKHNELSPLLLLSLKCIRNKIALNSNKVPDTENIVLGYYVFLQLQHLRVNELWKIIMKQMGSGISKLVRQLSAEELVVFFVLFCFLLLTKVTFPGAARDRTQTPSICEVSFISQQIFSDCSLKTIAIALRLIYHSTVFYSSL